jgi:hypothetical protein
MGGGKNRITYVKKSNRVIDFKDKCVKPMICKQIDAAAI